MDRLRILVVRHAEPVVATVDGPPEPLRPLTERGHRQAEELADELCAAAPHTIVSSPYRRALDTVRPASRRLGLQVELLDDLREWRSGLRPTPDWKRHYLRCWEDPAHAAPGAESHDQARARMLAALDRIVARWRSRGGTVVAGTHGTVISLALAGLGAPVDTSFWFGMPMPAVYRFEVDATGSWSGVRGPGLPSDWTPTQRPTGPG
jgi:2,3-bisphosphoglycerate-dependent phosphoglycerate mutase